MANKKTLAKEKKSVEKVAETELKKPSKKIQTKKPKVNFSPKKAEEVDPWNIILYPHMAEKSMASVDLQNKIVFVVSRTSTKPEIKKAFEKLFDVKVVSVKTENTLQGQKKAFIKLHPDYSAADIATRLGIL